MKHSPYKILGLGKNVSPDEIKKAFRTQARLSHPDKQKNFDDERMKMLNWAYKTLNDEEELKKWEVQASDEDLIDPEAELITTSSKRFSEGFRMEFEINKIIISVQAPEKREAIEKTAHLRDIEKFSASLPGEVYTLPDGTKFHDIYSLVDFKSKNVISDNYWEPKTWSIDHAFTTLKKFLRGKLYGRPLSDAIKDLKNFCNSNGVLYVSSKKIFDSVLTIIAEKNINNRAIYDAVNDITSFYTNIIKKNDISYAELLEDENFRNFSAYAIRSYWLHQTPEPILEVVQNLENRHGESLKKAPTFRALNKSMQSYIEAFSKESCPEKLYEEAYKQIDLSICGIGVEVKPNSLILAGMAFQQASRIEKDEIHAAAAERSALKIYQVAIHIARTQTPMLELYTLSSVIKNLSYFTYTHPVRIISKEEMLEFLNKQLKDSLNPGDSSIMTLNMSLDQTVAGAIKKAIYLNDLMPMTAMPCSHIDLIFIHLAGMSHMRNQVQRLARNKSLSLAQRAKPIYHLYEGALNGWIKGENPKILRLHSMAACLEEEGTSMKEMGGYLHPIKSSMPVDQDGYRRPISELNLPEGSDQNIIFQSVNGIEINEKTGEIGVVTTKWTEEMPKSQRLITNFDLNEMLKYGVSGGFFSLDHPDSNKHYHPLQKMRFSPEELIHTEFLRSMFETDYLLKQLSMGVEIATRAPFRQRKCEQMISHLPEKLQKIFTDIHEHHSMSDSGVSRRFWIEVGELEMSEKSENGVKKIEFGPIKMKVKTQLLKINADGNLVDDENDKHNSPDDKFAKAFTENYAEIAEYFPEFARLAQFARMQAVNMVLKSIKQSVPENIETLTKEVKRLEENIAKVNEKRSELLTNNINQMRSEIINKLPAKFTYSVNDSEVTNIFNQLYQNRYNELFNENYNRIRTAVLADVKKNNSFRPNTTDDQIIAMLKEQGTDIHANLKKQLDAEFSPQKFKEQVCSQLNQQGSSARISFRSQIVNAFPQELKNYMGANFNSAVESLLSKNPNPMANGLTDHAIHTTRTLLLKQKADVQSILHAKEKTSRILNEMLLGEGISSKTSSNLFAPSVSFLKGSYRVYGGVLSFPRILPVAAISSSLSIYAAGAAILSSSINYARNWLKNNTPPINSSCLEWQDFNTLSKEIVDAEQRLYCFNTFNDPNPNFNNYSILSQSALSSENISASGLNPSTVARATAFREQQQGEMKPVEVTSHFLNQLKVKIDDIAVPEKEKSFLDRKTEELYEQVDTKSSDYLDGTVKGIGLALLDIGTIAIHPVDKFLYPMSQLLHDAIVVSGKQMLIHDPDIEFLTGNAKEDDKLYQESVARMEARGKGIKDAAVDFYKAEGPDKTKKGVRLATTVLVTKKFVNAARKITGIDKAANLEKFGHENPTMFGMRGKEKWIPKIDVDSLKLTMEEIRNHGKNIISDPLMYVVDGEGKLVVTQSMYDHCQLGKFKPVAAAGDLHVGKNGHIIRIDSRSGSYLPISPTLKTVVENAFIRAGFTEAAGKFIYWNETLSPELLKGMGSPIIVTPNNAAATTAASTGVFVNRLEEERKKAQAQENISK